MRTAAYLFKRDATDVDSLVAEMATFANSEGGTIFLGVANDGSLPGMSRVNVARLNQRKRGLGSGIKRALEDWPDIDFTDDRDGCLFTATVQRKEVGGLVEPGIGSEKSSAKAEGSQKSSQKIIELMQDDPTITIADLAQSVGVTDRAIKKQIEKLKAQGQIRRIGPDKGGHWEVVE